MMRMRTGTPSDSRHRERVSVGRLDLDIDQSE